MTTPTEKAVLLAKRDMKAAIETALEEFTLATGLPVNSISVTPFISVTPLYVSGREGPVAYAVHPDISINPERIET